METTCGNCKEVKFDPADKFSVAGCTLTEFVVPHYCDYTEKKLTFWRVPTACPRPSSEVRKSEVQTAKKNWVIKSFSDF